MANLSEAEILERRAERQKKKKNRAGPKYPNGATVQVGGRSCTVLNASINNETGAVSYFVADGDAERKVPESEVTSDESTSPGG